MKMRFAWLQIPCHKLHHPQQQLICRYHKHKTPSLYEMGSWYSVNDNFSVMGYFLAFFTDFGSFLRHFLSLRTIAQTFRLSISLQFLWLYKGYSGYCFDISISWACFYITLLNYNKRKCNKKPLEKDNLQGSCEGCSSLWFWIIIFLSFFYVQSLCLVYVHILI